MGETKGDLEMLRVAEDVEDTEADTEVVKVPVGTADNVRDTV